MRDLVIVLIVGLGSLYALRKPWIGILVWEWLGIMNPHRYTYGFAYSAPLAAVTAGATLLGFMFTRQKRSPVRGAPMYWLLALVVWMTLSWLLGLDVAGDYDQWNKVMKIDLMLFVALGVLITREQIVAFTVVVTASVALLAVKGGLFTLMTGGSYRVWGPPDSFISDNNEFALATVMTIPLVRFVQMQVKTRWLQLALTASMVLCGAAALGSQSRGALLAVAGMLAVFWFRGGNKLRNGFLIALLAVPLIAFMPASWSERMSSIDHYQDDGSAMGRINAWHVAWRIALDHPLGVGFNPATHEIFAQYAPDANDVHAAHSIYFQILGNHGFIGLAIFLGIWIATWRSANWIRNQQGLPPEAKWAVDLASMAQVSLAAYAVGGAFLSLAYFDLPYDLTVAVVATRYWVATRAWEKDTSEPSRWLRWLRLAPQ
ncbi:MAG: putative O-glycosylation ligase, exosortase A system-associated [Paucibacter sp.]|nr:putative O-glycosylation ligase, exosortase A system-associated [Roseateles sp.]